jgi:carbon-monoxide dehydrogenase medium subunit
MKFADFLIPTSLDEARAALKKLGAKGTPFAGGTAFQYVSDRPGMVAVDISRLGLAGIERRNGGFRIGANTTLAELVRFQDAGWVLGRIASLIPTHQIRNISTVGGNIARLFPWSELPLGLIALDARIVVQGDAEKSFSASEFFAQRSTQILSPGDLIVAVEAPAVAAGTGFGYRKESLTNSAFSLAAAAAVVTVSGGKLSSVRVAVGGAAPTPIALAPLDQALTGQRADESVFDPLVQEHAAGVPWKGREGMSDEYARHLAEVVITDALAEALKQAKQSR